VSVSEAIDYREKKRLNKDDTITTTMTTTTPTTTATATQTKILTPFQA